MSFIENNQDCCGCGLCENVCPNNAIQMVPNEEGFRFPSVNSKLCIGCNLCENKCPIFNRAQTPAGEIIEKVAYAGYYTSSDILRKCSSGGIVRAVATQVLKNNGLVFGVKYSDNYRTAEYTMIESVDDYEIIAKSKYVESDRSELFRLLPKAISSQKTVLVIGLPCDIAAVRSLVGYPPNLITCRLICMAIASRESLSQYLDYKEDEYKSKVINLDLRYKKYGEPAFPTRVKIDFENGESYEGLWTMQDHYRSFFIMNRISCNNCHFKTFDSSADLTVGDFQGLTDKKDYYNPDGVSLIFPHTKRGLEAIKMTEDFYYKQVDYDETAGYNWMIYHPYPKSVFREEFSKDFVKGGLRYACEELRANQRQKITEISDRLIKSKERVAVWGAGDTAEHMYTPLKMDEWNIIGVFDSSKLRIGNSFFGNEIHDVKSIGEYCDKADLVVAFIPSENETELNVSLNNRGWTKEILHVGKYKYYK